MQTRDFGSNAYLRSWLLWALHLSQPTVELHDLMKRGNFSRKAVLKRDGPKVHISQVRHTEYTKCNEIKVRGNKE